MSNDAMAKAIIHTGPSAAYEAAKIRITELEAKLAELEQQLKMTKHNYSGAMSDIKELEQHQAALEAAVRDMVEGMLERGAEIRELRKQLAELEQRIHEACEVYAGMEGFIPVHAETGYVLQTINQMYQELQESDDELG